MPLTRIVCPHCEQAIEVNTTSVTRSRECPYCGNTILLQVTTQEKRQRRKALLMPSIAAEQGSDDAPEPPPGLSVTPQPIKGDMRERMMMDPEVRQRVRVIKITLAVLSVIILVVVLGSVFHWWSGISDAVKNYSASRSAPTVDDSAGEPVKSEWHQPQKPVEKVTTPDPSNAFKVDAPPLDNAAKAKVVMDFLAAPSVNQRLNFILNRVSAEPKLREYYKHHPDGPIPFETVEDLGKDPALPDSYNFAVVLKDGERRRLLVRRSKAKGYLVDWPSFVIYSEMDWSEFVASKTTKPTLFRILAQNSDVYRGEFIDPQRFICIKLVNPVDMRTPPLYAYVLRSSSTGAGLDFIMRRAAGTAVPLMLMLKFPDAATSPDQVWVDDFVGEGWVALKW